MPKQGKETERVAKWANRLKGAENYAESHLWPGWKKTLKNFRGEYDTKTPADQHQVTVDVVKAITRLMVPSLYFRDPAVSCTPTRPNTEDLCSFTEDILNYYIKELHFKKEIKMCIQDAILFGIGFMKIGYETEVERAFEVITDEYSGEEMLDGDGNRLLQDDGENVYREMEGLVEPFMDSEGRRIPEGDRYPTTLERIRRESPFMVRWSPFDVLIDPDSRREDLSDATWIAFRSEVPLEEVKNNDQYKNTSKLEATKESTLLRHLRGKEDHEDRDLDKVVMYEIWSKDYNKDKQSYEMYWRVLAEGSEKFQLEDRSPYQMDTFPGFALTFLSDPESNKPISLIESVRPQIDVINVSRTQYTNHRERFTLKYLYNRSMGISDGDAKRIAKARSAAYIGVTADPGVDVRTAIAPMNTPDMDPSVYEDNQFAWDDIQRIWGIPQHYLGGTDVARQATQAGYIEQSLNVRVNEMQDTIGDFITDILRGVKQILQQYADFEFTLKVTSADEETWEKFTISDNIPDDLDFNVDMFTSSFQSKEKEREEVLGLINIMAPLSQQFPMDLRPLLERLFKAYGYPNPEIFFQQPQVAGMQAQQESGGGADPSQSLAEQAIDTNAMNELMNQSAGPQGAMGGG